MKRNLGIAGLLVIIVVGFMAAYILMSPEDQLGMDAMSDVEVDAPNVPPVAGYAKGEEVAFIHPEASDSEVQAMLSEMMDSPVILVPALAAVPTEALADVYVFTNGVAAEGEPRGPVRVPG